jgi:protein-tyrosine phosphatase
MTFMQSETPPVPPRHLGLKGTYNIRDIGGYRTASGRSTRWRTLFRADSLHRLTPEGQARLIADGLQTVVDLRRRDELEAAPNVFAASSTVRYHHISLSADVPHVPTGDPESLVTIYRRILDERQAQVHAVFSVLAAADGMPAVVHCTAGKDRTGVIVALLLRLAEVPTSTVIEDYVLTATYLGEPFMEETRQRALKRGYTWEQYYPLVTCLPTYMQVTLDYLDGTYGGAEAYLRHIGLSESQLSHLRNTLTV